MALRNDKTETSFSDTTAVLIKRLRDEHLDLTDCEQMNRLTHEAADDLERWRNLAQHLCYKLGHGPKRHALDPNRCGRCERVLG